MNNNKNIPELKEKRVAKLKQILGFFLLTLPAGAMQFASIYIFETLIGLEYYQAFAIGYAFATTWNFTVNRKKTFGDSVNYKKAAPPIVLFYLIFVLFAVGFTYLWGNYIEWGNFKPLSSYLGTFIVMIANFTSTFLICGKITAKFKQEKPTPETGKELTTEQVSNLNVESFTHAKKGIRSKLVNFFIKNIIVGKTKFIFHGEKPSEPSAFISNHTRIKGPLAIQYMYPGNVRTWSIYTLTEKETVKSHIQNEIINNIRGEKFFTWLLPMFVSPIAWYYKTQLNCIPVYHDMRVMKTISKSIETLKNGVNISLCPEIKDNIKNEVISDFTNGFAYLGFYYYRETGKRLKYYPIYSGQKLRQVHFGTPIEYNPDIPMKKQSLDITRYLENAITELARSLPPHKIITIYKGYKLDDNKKE